MFWGLIRDVEQLRDEMNWLLEFDPGGALALRCECGPIVNLYETPDEYIVVAEVPGADKTKFDVSLRGGALSIKGEYKSEQGSEGWIRDERPCGAFDRVVNLPELADPGKVDASYCGGLLKVRVAKSEAARPRRIEVKAC